MELIFIGDQDFLLSLITDIYAGPEDFLIFLEEALESGEYDLDEIRQLIYDYNRRC